MRKTNKIKNIISKSLIFILGIFILGIFGGCTFIQTKAPKVSEIIDSIKNTTDLSLMEQGNKNKLRKLYGISTKEIEEFALYIPKTNMEANEILILKVKNQDDIDEIKENIEKRIEKQSDSFRSYAPTQYELLENNILDVKGKYIIYIVSKDVDKISKCVDNDFK